MFAGEGATSERNAMSGSGCERGFYFS